MKQDLEQVLGWVRRLAPPDTPGLLWVGSKSTNFRGERFRPDQLDDLLREVAKRDHDPGVFLRMTTIRSEAEKRGTADDSVALLGLWADIDIEGPGHKHDPSRYQGRRLPPDEDTAREFVADLPEPTAWVRSGGGLYPFWLPAQPWALGEQAEQFASLSADLQAHIGQRAELLGWHYGTGVGDLARILRIPGTVNRKIQGKPTACEIEWGGGPRYTYDELRQVVPRPVVSSARPVVSPAARQAPIPTPTPRRTRLVAPKSPWDDNPDAVGPLDDYAQRNDLCQLLEGDGWTFVYEAQGRRHYARPGKQARDGISGNVYALDGRQVLYVFSEGAGLPSFRAMSSGEWYAHRYHGGDLRTAARALRQAGYGSTPTTGLPSTGSARDSPPGTSTPQHLPAVISNVSDDLWSRRPVFGAIRALARRRRVGPWAVLGGVLAQVCCRIGPHVVLPPIVGGFASLNVFIGLVGPSGAGKGAATAVAEELLGFDFPVPTHEAGTGQGIDASFTSQTKEGPVQYNDTALFTLAEIDTLAAHAGMNGATLMPTMRKLYSGESLGAQYADRFKRRPVRAHHYRAAVIAGIQPARSGVLLDDADGGTPQRWVWLPTNDPERRVPMQTRRRLVPPAPPKWWLDFEVWSPVGEQPEDEPVMLKDRVEVDVCELAKEAIWNARDARLDMPLDEQANDMQGHALLTRLKVGALVGFLDRRAEVSEEDWELAGLIMAMSEATRALCQNALGRKAQAQSVSRGRSRAVQDEAAKETAEDIADSKRDRLAERLLKKLQVVGEPMTHGMLNQVAARDRAYLVPALEKLVSEGFISAQQDEKAIRYSALTK